MQYLSYLSILYASIRDLEMIKNEKTVQYFFDQLFIYKQHDVYSWYHYACYKALIKQNEAALSSLEKALQLGYGNYFTLMYDEDLASIRETPQFKALIKKYFPSGKNDAGK